MSNDSSHPNFKISTFCGKCKYCVAVANIDDMIAIRNTQDDTQKTLYFTKAEWASFIKGVKNNEFDFSQ